VLNNAFGNRSLHPTVTFEQNEDTGTTTTLELVLPWMLNSAIWQQGTPSPPTPSDVTPLLPG
jgi:hypothetical protein